MNRLKRFLTSDAGLSIGASLLILPLTALIVYRTAGDEIAIGFQYIAGIDRRILGSIAYYAMLLIAMSIWVVGKYVRRNHDPRYFNGTNILVAVGTSIVTAEIHAKTSGDPFMTHVLYWPLIATAEFVVRYWLGLLVIALLAVMCKIMAPSVERRITYRKDLRAMRRHTAPAGEHPLFQEELVKYQKERDSQQ